MGVAGKKQETYYMKTKSSMLLRSHLPMKMKAEYFKSHHFVSFWSCSSHAEAPVGISFDLCWKAVNKYIFLATACEGLAQSHTVQKSLHI